MKRLLLIISILWFGFSLVTAGDESNRHAALQALVERAENGDPKSLYDLASLYDRGYDSIPVDSAESTRLYQLSAAKGYAPARNYLGFRYYNGEYVNRDIDSALYWIQLAADAGDITAAGNLGFLLSQGEGIAHNYDSAIHWLKIGADGGLPTAISLLGDMYRQGLGCKADTIEAIALYESAHRAGVADAQIRLMAMMGYKWKELPPDSAFLQGLKYYKEGATIAGRELMERAIDGDIAKAFTILGDAYSRGDGVEYDYFKSIRYFLEGALRGEPSAEYIIAELLEFFPDILNSPEFQQIIERNSKDVTNYADLTNPGYWFERAANQGIKDTESAYENLFSP